ncbi:hypothetical protein ACLUTX_16035 [Enterobacterales bacterium AE_CKDN230030158-1A_HGKHYDSX7]
MMYVIYHWQESNFESYKTIGVFSSQETALAAIESLKELPGFKDYPEGFGVDPYHVDQVYWASGFGSE